jgi:dihydrofolate reductase
MLIYSMSVSIDGFIADREGAFGWTTPSEEQFRFHIAQVRELGGHLCGRRLYETMLPWETDPSLRDNEPGAAFADVWCAIPKVVFSRTLDSVQGNARLAEASLAEEVAGALDATDKDVAIGGAGLAAAAIELGLVDELRIFRNPVVVGGGTPFLPPVTEHVPRARRSRSTRHINRLMATETVAGSIERSRFRCSTTAAPRSRWPERRWRSPICASASARWRAPRRKTS